MCSGLGCKLDIYKLFGFLVLFSSLDGTFPTARASGSGQRSNPPDVSGDGSFLELTTSPPDQACLYSQITFTANLTHNPSIYNDADDTDYTYVWNDTVTGPKQMTGHGRYCEYSKVYDPRISGVKPGKYCMEVVVHNTLALKLIAQKTICFSLTEEINGEVTCRQQLPLSHPAGIFSSKLPINVTAVIYDNFIKPQFNFTWIIDGNILTSTTEPNYAFQLRKAREDLTVHVRIQARVHLPMSQLLVIRSANFRNFISTKDPLHHINFTSGQRNKTGALIGSQFSCDGSVPISLSWDLLYQPDLTTPTRHLASGNITDSNVRLFPIHQKLDQMGIYNITARAKNDVSNLKKVFIINVFPPDEDPRQLHILVPVIVLVLVLSLVFGLCAVFVPPKPRGLVEQADFDFHSRYMDCHPQFIRLRVIVSSLFERNNYSGLYSRTARAPAPRYTPASGYESEGRSLLIK